MSETPAERKRRRLELAAAIGRRAGLLAVFAEDLAEHEALAEEIAGAGRLVGELVGLVFAVERLAGARGDRTDGGQAKHRV